MQAVAGQVVLRMEEFNPQDLTSTIWAFATLGVKVEELLRAAARQAVWRMGEFTPKDVTNTMWGYATLAVKDDEILDHHVYDIILQISS